jgi:3-mercaptopyruvate sulfurtransferase SseA
MIEYGIDQVYALKGGYTLWVSEGNPVDSGP